MTIAELTSLSYDEKLQEEYGFSPAEIEEHKRELDEFYLDLTLDEKWNEENTEDLEQLVTSSQFLEY